MEEKIIPHMVSSKDTFADSEYIEWVHEIKQRYRNSQIKAAVKVNSEQLLFNWQLGRDLVIRKAEEKWGTGIVEQLSLDLQAEFPGAKGFSARNLWFMKQWYTFYASESSSKSVISDMELRINMSSSKLKQVASEIMDQKLKQVVSELTFPSSFAYVPWGHHVMIIQRAKSVEEAVFYIQKAIEGSLSRNALDDVIRADLYHSSGNALTNFTEQLPIVQGKLAQEILKSNYDLGFVSLPEGYDEDALEDILEKRMTVLKILFIND